jgi:hypothetical protein
MLEHRFLTALALVLSIPGQGQTPFIYAMSQDTSVNLTRPRIYEQIGPDLYRVYGGSGNNDSAWAYSADIDANGLLSNVRTMRCGVNTTNAMPGCMLRTSDQGMLVAFGLPSPGTNSFAFAKLDAAGAVQWYRNYLDVYGQWMVDSDRALAEKDGHYFTMGRITTVPPNQGHASCMVELDSMGVCVAQHIWAGGDVWSGEGAGIVRTADNGLLTVATEHIYSGVSSFPNMSVQRWDAALQVVWSNRYSLGYFHSLVRALATADGGALLTGSIYPTMGGQQYPFFLRLDAAGQVLWAKRASATGMVPTGAVEEPDGGFAISLFGIGSTPVVARLDDMGALVSVQAAGDFPNVYAWGISRDSITGDHLVRAAGAAGTYLMRLDASLAFACGNISLPWTDTLVTAAVSAFPVTVTTSMLASSDTVWSSHSSAYTAVDLCLSAAVPEASVPQLRTWPVPADDIVHVAWNTGSTAIRYALLDQMGRVVKHGTPANSSDGSLSIHVHDLGSGIYLLRLEAAEGVRTVQVVK